MCLLSYVSVLPSPIKAHMRIIILATLLLTLVACTSEQPTEKTDNASAELARQSEANKPRTNQPTEVDMTAKNPYTTPATGAKESESFKRHFSGKEQATLLKLKQTFEAGYVRRTKNRQVESLL